MANSSGSGSPTIVRVLTMNVYGPGNPDWDRRHRLVGETIRTLDPDVIALQEVPVDSTETLARLVGTHHHLTHFSRPSVLDQPVGCLWASDHYGVFAQLVAPRNRPGFRS